MTARELGLVLLSAALHALWSVVIKGSRDAVVFNWLQMLPGALLAVAVLAALPAAIELPARFWAIATAAGLCHGLYMYWMGRAFEVGELSMVYPIARSTPAILPFVAVPLLGEHISALGAIGIVTVVGGMWLVQTNGQLRLASLAPRGALFAWLTLVATVGYGLTDKSAMGLLQDSQWEGPIGRAVFYFLLTTLGGSIALAPFALRRGGARLAEVARGEGGQAVAALLMSLVGYSLILEALRSAQVSYVVAVRQASVLFAVALSAVWLHERPTRARIAGSVIIVIGVALLGGAG